MALTVGETLTITATFSGAVSAVLKIGGAGVGSYSMTGGAGDEWSVDIDTTNLSAGKYLTEIWRTDSGGKKTVVMRDQFTLRAALKEADLRSDAQKALDAINAVLAGRATDGVLSYKIGMRELRRYQMAELLQLKSHFAAIVQSENRKAKGIKGLGPNLRVYF